MPFLYKAVTIKEIRMVAGRDDGMMPGSAERHERNGRANERKNACLHTPMKRLQLLRLT